MFDKKVVLPITAVEVQLDIMLGDSTPLSVHFCQSCCV